jgi:hypothetical protein
VTIAELRAEYHSRLCKDVIRWSSGACGAYPNFADSASKASVAIARSIADQIGFASTSTPIDGQTAGKGFERITHKFLEDAFGRLQHLRPGNWLYSANQNIAEFDQYRHLGELQRVIKDHPELECALRMDYIVMPDIVIARYPVPDSEINLHGPLVSDTMPYALDTPLRQANGTTAILHASISCKWTLRSDRSQNARTEALNLSRNRKGTSPHIVAVTAEPLPSRIASLALGTGDLDCVYHFALYELRKALQDLGSDLLDQLDTMCEGRRLRDISDLPFDLAI